MSLKEMDELIRASRRALRSHRKDSLSPNPDTAEDFLAAIDTIKGTLRDLWEVAPDDRRAQIEELIEKG